MLADRVHRLTDLAIRGETARVIAMLRQIVPTFRRDSPPAVATVHGRNGHKKHAPTTHVRPQAVAATLLRQPRRRLAQG